MMYKLIGSQKTGDGKRDWVEWIRGNEVYTWEHIVSSYCYTPTLKIRLYIH